MVIALTACSTETATPTAGFQRTRAARTPTSEPGTETPVPTAVPTLVSSPSPVPSALPTATLDKNQAVTDCNMAAFSSNITIFDGTKIGPGKPFAKTWQLRNTGTCTWSTGYSIVFVNGTRLGGDSAVSMPNAVAPGSYVNITANLYAPTDAGNFTSYWMIKSDSGELFGVGPGRNQPFWVNIVVMNLAVNNTPNP